MAGTRNLIQDRKNETGIYNETDRKEEIPFKDREV